MSTKIILLTGASSGIGFETAKILAQQGHTVYGVARRVEKLEGLSKFGVKFLYFDITDTQSMSSLLSRILAEEGRIDVLINNAGYGSFGAIEDVDINEARQQFEVNLFGLATLTQQILPQMRRQKQGLIINVASIAGHFTSPFGAWYHASKYALEAFSDALRMEVEEFGIKVSIIEPGGIKTPWGHIAADHLELSSKNGAYEEKASKMAGKMRKLYNSSLMSNPLVVAKGISKAVNAHRPKTRYRIGFMAKPLVFLHSILPTRVFDKIIKSVN